MIASQASLSRSLVLQVLVSLGNPWWWLPLLLLLLFVIVATISSSCSFCRRCFKIELISPKVWPPESDPTPVLPLPTRQILIVLRKQFVVADSIACCCRVVLRFVARSLVEISGSVLIFAPTKATQLVARFFARLGKELTRLSWPSSKCLSSNES